MGNRNPNAQGDGGAKPSSSTGGVNSVDLAQYSNIALIEGFPREVALEFGVLPIRKEADGSILLALPSTSGVDLIDELRFAFPKPFRPVFADPEQIEERLRRVYGGRDIARMATAAGGKLGALAEPHEDAATADAVSLFRKTLEEAVRARASDIHFEPMPDRYRVRFRIDGVLHEVNTLPTTIQGALTSHIKIASGMDITERRLPQDGRIEFKGNIDLRCSALPTNHGESVVLRILERGIASYNIEQLGLFPDHRKVVDSFLAVQDGFIVVTGPTGSGKTTSLYAYLRALANPSVKIITVEDPVEYITEGFTQVPVDAKYGTDFASALRSILRHDPDIVLLGEIRDEETARTALQAALTGHQVFSTLHTNDAPSAVGRLLNLGVEPFLVNAALTAVIAQRLVRSICPDCKEEYAPSDAEKHRYERGKIPVPARLFRGKGCPNCYTTGYRSRMGVFEFVTVNPEIQELILQRAPASRIREAARRAGMLDMFQDGLRKAAAGSTTIEEIVRVLC